MKYLPVTTRLSTYPQGNDLCLPVINTQTTYQIIGFDRLNFVNDVAQAVPQDEHNRIISLAFEGDGVRVDGYLTIWLRDRRGLPKIEQRLETIRGLISLEKKYT